MADGSSFGASDSIAGDKCCLCRGHASSHGTDRIQRHAHKYTKVLTIVSGFMKYSAEVNSGEIIFLMFLFPPLKQSIPRKGREEDRGFP